MADPHLNPVTLRLSPWDLEAAFWRAPATSRALRLTDRIGLCGALLSNGMLIMVFLRGGSGQWRSPAFALAVACVQLAVSTRATAFYTRHRTSWQVFNRVIRWLVPIAMWRRRRTGVQLQLMAAPPFAQASTRSLVAVLLAEPGVAALGVFNFSVPFNIHLVLFLARAFIDLFGVAKVMGCSLARLQLEPSLSATCLAVDRISIVLLGVGHPKEEVQSTCTRHAHRFLPSILLVFVGGMLGLIYNWWVVAACGLLGARAWSTGALACAQQAAACLRLRPAAGTLLALALTPAVAAHPEGGPSTT